VYFLKQNRNPASRNEELIYIKKKRKKKKKKEIKHQPAGIHLH